MYLSRLVVNARDGQARLDLANCQDLHRTLMRAYPDVRGAEPGRAHAGLLFRIEPEHLRVTAADGRGSIAAPVVLTQSRLEPDWSRLPIGYLLRPPVCKDISSVLDVLRDGARFRFRLRANVVRAQLDPAEQPGQHSRGKRVALHGEQNQIAWLERKGETGGSRLCQTPTSPAESARHRVASVRVAPEADVLGRRHDVQVGRRAPLTFGAVLFEGGLEVADLAAFRVSVEQGIGPGKAYGFGLLSLGRLGAAEGSWHGRLGG